MGSIAFVGNAFAGPNTGGTEWLTRAIAHAVAAAGHSVRWVACSPVLQDPELTRLGVVSHRYDPDLASSRSPIDALTKLCADADAVHFTHFARWGTDAATALATNGLVVTATLTDYNVLCPDHQLFNTMTLRTCDATGGAECAYVCRDEGPAQLQSYRQRNVDALNAACAGIWCQTPHQRSILTEHGLRDDLVRDDHAHYFVPPEWSELLGAIQAERFLYVGRCSEEKGLRLLWDVFRALPECGIDLIWDADDEELWAELVGDLPDNIRLHSSMPLADLGPFLARARALVIPSLWWENHATVMDYAHALGTRVIASAQPSLTHLQGRETLTLVAPPDDQRAWVRVLQETWSRPGPTDAGAFAELQASFNDMIADMCYIWFAESGG